MYKLITVCNLVSLINSIALTKKKPVSVITLSGLHCNKEFNEKYVLAFGDWSLLNENNKSFPI